MTVIQFYTLKVLVTVYNSLCFYFRYLFGYLGKYFQGNAQVVYRQFCLIAACI